MFLAKVFTNLLLQILIMYVSAKQASKLIGPPSGYDIILYLLKLLLLIVIAFVPLTLPFKFLLLTLFSALAGAAVRDRKKIEEALREATFIFLVMVVIGVVSIQLGLDLRPIGIILFLSLIALFIFRIFNVTSREDYIKIVTIIFALFVVYDTNNIMQRDYDGDFVDATLDYFQDFSSILSMQLAGDED